MALLKAMFEFLSFGHTIFQHRSGLKRLNLVNLINFGPTVYLPTYCWSWNLVKLKINFQILHSLCFMSSLLLATIFSLSFSFSLFFVKNGPSPASFCFFQSFSNKQQFLQQINVKNVHPVLGFEPITFRMWVPPVTTRPGLLLNSISLLLIQSLI